MNRLLAGLCLFTWAAGCVSGRVEVPDQSDAGRSDAHTADAAAGPDASAPTADSGTSPGRDATASGPDAAAQAGEDASTLAGLDAAAPDTGVLPTCVAGPKDCSPGTGDGLDCYDLASMFKNQVTSAVQQILTDHPEYFDFNQGYPCCPLTVNPEAFVQAVVANVQAQGLCSIRDPNDGNEVVVKIANDCAENFGLVTSANLVRNPPKFQGTCAPAWF
jgi:hypothetical protein